MARSFFKNRQPKPSVAERRAAYDDRMRREAGIPTKEEEEAMWVAERAKISEEWRRSTDEAIGRITASFYRDESRPPEKVRAGPKPKERVVDPDVRQIHAIMEDLSSLVDRETRTTLNSYDEADIYNFVSGVLFLREDSPGITDWQVHLNAQSFRNDEDPGMATVAQMSNVLLEGRKDEASYPF